MNPLPSLADESALLRKLIAHAMDALLLRWNARVGARTSVQLACFPRDWIGRAIIVNGLYERELLATLREVVFTRWPREGALALDVGANIGNHTLSFAPYFEAVVAIEPNPVALHLLRANLLFNGVANVEVEACGLGVADAEVAFEVPAGNLGGGSFRPGSASVIRLQVRRCDVLLAAHLHSGRTLRFVKIDAEDFEPLVVRGLGETLAAQRPVVAFESNGGVGSVTKAEFDRLGYRHYAVTERASALPRALR